jgi:hypothetical protein
MNAWRRLIFCSLAVFAAVVSALLSGCGGDRHAVEGSVTLDNAAVNGGMIQFVAQGEGAAVKRMNTYAEIIDGKYSLPAGQGPSPGKYKVVITWNKKTGKKVDAGGDPGNKIDETFEAIPKKYNRDSTEIVEIKSSANRFDYAIKSVKESSRDHN